VRTRHGSYWVTVAAGWILLTFAAIAYARLKSVPLTLAAPVAAAFLLEYPFYILAAFDGPRETIGRWKKGYIAAFLTLTAIAPWLFYILATGHFALPPLLLLTAIALSVSCWYLLWPASPIADLLFLGLLAAIILSKIFDVLYPSPIPKVAISYLGHIMLIRTGALALFLIRGNIPASFRLIPNRKEWRIGITYFAALLPVAGAAYYALGLFELRPRPQNILIGLGTFPGILWVVALSEEFFFRGLLQNWLGTWTRNSTFALVVTSLLFGSVHLGFRFHSEYPNWRFATIAAIAGLFYGLAARRAGAIQASMVTHALTVTVWRVFLH
jgi:membrane protease YdiL (CAAX protease family)